MNPGINTRFLEENNKTEMNHSLSPGLSEEAFYLIVLGNLLKKEFGEQSFEQYLIPVGLPVYKLKSGR
jgi:hypothetical protein